MKKPLFMDFIRPRRTTQVPPSHPSNRLKTASEDDYLEESIENPDFDDNFTMDYSALSDFAETEVDTDVPTREEQAELAESDPSDFVSEPKSFAATILKFSNREKVEKNPGSRSVRPDADIDYDSRPSRVATDITPVARPPRPIARVTEPAPAVDIAPVRPLTPADEVPLQYKTREELLELAEKQASAMQNTREARAARAHREAEAAAARARELEERRIAEEMAKLEQLRLSRQQKYPPRPNFVNTNVNKRPLSRSNGSAVTAPVSPALTNPVYLSSANPVPHELPTSPRKKPRKAQEEPTTPRFINPAPRAFTRARTSEDYDLDRLSHREERATRSHSAAVIVPSAGSRRSPNLTIFIFIAILAGAIVGAVAYLLFLSK